MMTSLFGFLKVHFDANNDVSNITTGQGSQCYFSTWGRGQENVEKNILGINILYYIILQNIYIIEYIYYIILLPRPYRPFPRRRDPCRSALIVVPTRDHSLLLSLFVYHVLSWQVAPSHLIPEQQLPIPTFFRNIILKRTFFELGKHFRRSLVQLWLCLLELSKKFLNTSNFTYTWGFDGLRSIVIRIQFFLSTHCGGFRSQHNQTRVEEAI